MTTTTISARICDGERVLAEQTVVVDGAQIAAVGGPVHPDSAVVDARGATLQPGLIDAHAHTNLPALQQALSFGVTTELEMGGPKSAGLRREIAGRDDVADLRWVGFGVTPPRGHPHELSAGMDVFGAGFAEPSAATPAEATALVESNVAQGVDDLKIMIEGGTVVNRPGLPMLDQSTLEAANGAAHAHGKLASAHAMTAEAAEQAVQTGMDGLAHIHIDRPHTPGLVAAVAASGAFVTACPTLTASMLGNAGRTGHTGTAFAADPRARSKLSQPWTDTLGATVGALHRAGVDTLTGTTPRCPWSTWAASPTARACTMSCSCWCRLDPRRWRRCARRSRGPPADFT